MGSIMINILIGVIAIVGFFIYWGKASGVFKEGGLLNNWWKNFRTHQKGSNNKEKKQ